ncbi:hypothetical protein [Streptomyces cucumeris]|nr:hypothetical protein [Streptomyces sp. NEAU-Y11]
MATEQPPKDGMTPRERFIRGAEVVLKRYGYDATKEAESVPED